MPKYLKKRLKYILLASACAVTCAALGITGCTKETPKPDEEKKTSKEDTQLLKNGNFEFLTEFDDDAKAVYLIDNVENWSHGGTSSSSRSGIIGVSDAAWEAITAESLANKLDYNNALDSNAANYKDLHVDYNGMTSKDLLFADTYEAVNYDVNDESGKEDPRKSFISNPGTHYGVQKGSDGNYFYLDAANIEQPVYLDDSGNYYFDKELTKPFSHVLMLHNYNSDHNGIAQYYSSVSVDLPANTAAEVSFWVKTCNLQFSQGETVTQDRGAYAAISHTVGSTALDDFEISSINTEKLLNDKNAYYDSHITEVSNNGWVQYTVYVNACDFADTTITLKMGLGGDDALVEGYAFFDDVQVTKFVSLDDEGCSYSKNSQKIGEAACTLLSDADKKIFKADYYSRNGGTFTDERYSKNYFYLLDLASDKDYTAVDLTNFKVAPTVDADKYTTVKNAEYKGKLLNLTSASIENASALKLPKNFSSFATESDLLACVKAGYEFTADDTSYYSRLNSALTSAAKLPKVDESTNNNVLVMLSAYGAAYTASMETPVQGGVYAIVSFWVKTSDFSDATAVTVKVTEKDNNENTQNFTIDTTGTTTDLDDKENIYNGWVQCFLYLNNENKSSAANVKIDVSLGNTAIKDSEITSYKAGWAAIANVQTLIADEDTFNYISSGDHTATLTVGKEKAANEPSVFDTPYGSQSHEIESDIVNPSTYYGVNGASSSIVNNGVISLPYDDINTNDFAGLINKDYFANYKENNCEWYDMLLESFNASSLDATAAWNEIFGSNSVQPLIIVNKLRETYMREKSANENNYKSYFVKNEDGSFTKVGNDDEFDENEVYYRTQEVMNYGFIGKDSTASADGYTVVSVKVKVSEGAIAHVYLVDDKEVIKFTTPKYTYYYDEDGNVLKSKADDKAPITEQRENILYSLRDDGLYEDKDGKLFANTHNYTKLYDDENASYYDANGSQISFENLVKGETYYKDANATQQADCYLVNDSDIKLYRYENGKYYYLVDGKKTSEVNPFDTNFARYDYGSVSEEFAVTIEGSEETAKNWTTVNFVIHTGNKEKSYHLELWSGSRENYYDDVEAGGTVIFDYSYLTVSDEKFAAYYEGEIIECYKRVLEENNLLKDNLLDSSDENIHYYEELINKYIASGDLSKEDLTKNELNGLLANYKSYYYTYTLYDSPNYQPFNAETAGENETGYDYKYGDYDEQLAYLSVKDGNDVNVFVDYSAFDKDIKLDTDDEETSEETTEEDEDETSAWLLISSIILVVVLLFAMLSLYARHLYKKYHRKSVNSKNNYNTAKANRYIKKLHIKKDVYEEVENPIAPSENNAEANEESVENTTETPEAKAETVESEEAPEATAESVASEEASTAKEESVENTSVPSDENGENN